MRDSHTSSIPTLINSTNKLFSLQQKALFILKLNQVVQQQLSVKLREHCKVANYRDNVLVIEVENANWLSLLRYEEENLRHTLLKSILPSLTRISLYINPNLRNECLKITQNITKTTSSAPSFIPLSLKSGYFLRSATQNGSKKLQKAVEKLIKQANEKNA